MRRMALAAVTLLAGPANAQADPWRNPPEAWEGVWKGTVGKSPVHLCLDTTPYRKTGAYYYDRYRELIILELGGGGQSWVEKGTDDRPGPSWRITAQGRDALAGSWSDGRNRLPVRLGRIGKPSAEFEGPCGSMEFHRPRLRPVAVSQKSDIKDGARLTTSTFKPGRPFENVEITTFTLERPGAAIARVNALLKAILPGPGGGGDWLDCMAGNANALGVDGDFAEGIEPTMVATRWLATLHRSDSFCGGAHPNTDIRYRTFDLQQGIEVDPRDWFAPRAVKVDRVERDQLKTLTPAFRTVLLARYRPEDRDCEGVMADQEYWSVGVVRGALVFQPQLPRVVMACGEEIRMSFDQLQPWLNPRGKAAVASLPR